MPAAAVIPAPTAYINVVAVKKLVVEVMTCPLKFQCFLPLRVVSIVFLGLSYFCCFGASGFTVACFLQHITVNKLECSKQMYI